MKRIHRGLLLLALVVASTCCSSTASAAKYLLEARGLLPFVSPPHGVADEGVTLRALLDPADWEIDPISNQFDHFFRPLRSVPLVMIGDVSGALPNIGDLQRMYAREASAALGDDLVFENGSTNSLANVYSAYNSGANGFPENVVVLPPEKFLDWLKRAIDDPLNWPHGNSLAIADDGNYLYFISDITWTMTEVPEPSGVLMLGLGIAALVAMCAAPKRKRVIYFKGNDRNARLLPFACWLFAALGVSGASVAAGAPITAPAGLAPGEEYRLVFVTNTGAVAVSSDIETYNTFVTNAAQAVPELAALATTWKVIGSTSSIDARDNTGTAPTVANVGVPFFNLDGELVASSNSDLWDGALTSPIHVNEFGDDFFGGVATGTNAAGTRNSLLPFGSSGDGVILGESSQMDQRWMLWDSDWKTAQHSLYAMSGILTVVPEPSSLLLGLIVVAGLAAATALRRA